MDLHLLLLKGAPLTTEGAPAFMEEDSSVGVVPSLLAQ